MARAQGFTRVPWGWRFCYLFVGEAPGNDWRVTTFCARGAGVVTPAASLTYLQHRRLLQAYLEDHAACPKRNYRILLWIHLQRSNRWEKNVAQGIGYTQLFDTDTSKEDCNTADASDYESRVHGYTSPLCSAACRLRVTSLQSLTSLPNLHVLVYFLTKVVMIAHKLIADCLACHSWWSAGL